jgi:hypothetical protein
MSVGRQGRIGGLVSCRRGAERQRRKEKDMFSIVDLGTTDRHGMVWRWVKMMGCSSNSSFGMGDYLK